MTIIDLARCRMVDFVVRGDERGSLIALEGKVDLPFEVRRVYYIFDTQSDVVRGRHAHHALNQLLVAVRGGCTIHLDDGCRRDDVRLDRPEQGLLLGTMVWREMSEFTPDCVLLVLADAPYDEGDYIRDYDRFLKLASS